VVHALRGIDLSIEAGEFIALMGPSGCGKSTLLILLGCLDNPTQGVYTLEGRDVARLSVRERANLRSRRIGFVFQNFYLLNGLNALDNVALPLLYQHNSVSVGKLAEEALSQVGLADRARHHPNEMSGGSANA